MEYLRDAPTMSFHSSGVICPCWSRWADQPAAQVGERGGVDEVVRLHLDQRAGGDEAIERGAHRARVGPDLGRDVLGARRGEAPGGEARGQIGVDAGGGLVGAAARPAGARAPDHVALGLDGAASQERGDQLVEQARRQGAGQARAQLLARHVAGLGLVKGVEVAEGLLLEARERLGVAVDGALAGAGRDQLAALDQASKRVGDVGAGQAGAADQVGHVAAGGAGGLHLERDALIAIGLGQGAQHLAGAGRGAAQLRRLHAQHLAAAQRGAVVLLHDSAARDEAVAGQGAQRRGDVEVELDQALLARLQALAIDEDQGGRDLRGGVMDEHAAAPAERAARAGQVAEAGVDEVAGLERAGWGEQVAAPQIVAADARQVERAAHPGARGRGRPAPCTSMPRTLASTPRG